MIRVLVIVAGSQYRLRFETVSAHDDAEKSTKFVLLIGSSTHFFSPAAGVTVANGRNGHLFYCLPRGAQGGQTGWVGDHSPRDQLRLPPRSPRGARRCAVPHAEDGTHAETPFLCETVVHVQV